MISFASDNTAGVHPDILASLARVNHGWTPAYGADAYTAELDALFQKHFGPSARPFLVFNGTAANVLSISSFLRPFDAVVSAISSHLQNDECGALERFAGCKIILQPTYEGKLRVEDLEPLLEARGDCHRAQPRIITLTQSTEFGTLYTPDEIRTLTDFAHANDLFVHMDGTRLSNAAAALNLSLQELTEATGIDVLSFGGTKNGLICGEAVVFFGNAERAANFEYFRKQGLQLASKMRFLSAQFTTYLESGLWRKNAEHANRMCERLRRAVQEHVELAAPSQANALFVKLSPEQIATLQKEFYFYVFDTAQGIVRWMTSFETTPEQVDQFAAAILRVVR
ncbi:MAG: threonine aldolase [Bdellovibrionales bacterium]|nr:threonine aldolase [Bdellovibrionales bacterium]